MDISNIPIEKLAEMAIQKPEDFGYWGDKEMFVTWGFTGHDRSAMSKILENANFVAISDDLIRKYPDDFRVEQYKHWACGWVDRLVCKVLLHKDGGFVRENITEAFIAAMDYHERLQDEGIISDELYYGYQAEEILRSISDLPKYLSDMIDQDSPFWVDTVLSTLEYEMNVYIDPDADVWPKDSEILMAVYMSELWNTENIHLWEDFCFENKLEFPPKRKNKNQLSLFGE